MKQIMHRILVVIGIAAAVALASATSMAQTIAVTPGTINTIAGNGVAGEPSPGSVASGNSIEPVYAIAVAPILNGAGGDIYFSESTNYVKVIYEGGAAAKNIILANAALNNDVTTPVVGDIYLIAGNGTAVDGDVSTGAEGGSPGTWLLSSSAVFTAPCGLAVDSYGNLFISNPGNSSGTNYYVNNVVQVVYAGNISAQGINPAANLINLENTSLSVSSLTTGTTYNGYLFNIAGTDQSDSDNAVPGWKIGADNLHGVVVDNYENVYIASDAGSSSAVYMIYSGAGANALNLLQEEGYTGIVAGYGYKLAGGITDQENDYGDGSLGYEGAGVGEAGTPTSAPYNVWGIGVNPTTGDVYFSDSKPGKVRKLSASTGIISTVVGPNSGTADSGTSGGDGGLGNDGTNASESAALHTPLGIYVDAGGNVYIADSLNNAIRKLDANGYISTIAGTNTTTGAYSGDSGNATAANLNTPYDVKLDASGNLWIADEGNSRIREVTVNASVAGTQGSSVTSSGSFAFGNVTDYSNSAAVAALISNLTGSAITPSNVSIPDDYVQVAGGNAEAPDCSTSTAIPAGTTCTLALEFAPVSAGLNSASATVAANSDSITIPMTGTGVEGVISTPTFSPAAGTYNSAQTVTISDTTPSSTIYYTTNGTTPTTSSSVYSGPISVAASETVEALAVKSGDTNSAVGSAAYTITLAATPTFSPAAGSYASAQTVTISDATSGATIYYTTNGTTPTTSSTVYSAPISVSASETVDAIAAETGYTTSAVGSAAYTITSTVATPTFSPAAGTYNSTQTVTISDSTSGTTIYYTTSGLKPTTSSTVYTSPITVSAGETVKAIAVASGSTSAVASAKYTIQAVTPTLSPGAGTYTTPQSVTISTTTPSATIYYTTDGTTPTTGSPVYSGPVAVSSTEIVKAIATAPGYTNSAVASVKYTFPAVTPTLSPGAGTYTTPQSVTISTTTPSATIYYTTDGTTPTTGSPVYSGPVAVSSTETIKAIATASGYTNSAVGSAKYTFKAATPAFSPAAGTYNSAQMVTISDTTPSSTIYYTTDGTTPTTSSTVYSAPISVTASETVKAIAVAAGSSNSAVGTAKYSFTVATPVFSPGAGTYSSTQTVTISTTTPMTTIYYTTNGKTPTTNSPAYFGPITVSSNETIQAMARATGYTNSAIASAAYIVNASPAATPMFSPAAGTYTSAQTVTISDATSGATIYYTTNGTTPTTSSTVYSAPISVAASETVEAIAVATGYTTSTVGSTAYTITLGTAAATPTFSPAAGSYGSAQTVTISDATSGATIYYTTNGTTPTTSSTVYSAPISVAASETVEAIAAATGYTTSAVGSAAYTVTMGGSAAATPTFSPAAGSYGSAQTVTISDATSGATIYYTTNGTTPTTSSSVYSAPISVAASETVEAIAAATGYTTSAVGSAAYSITLGTVAAPTFSPGAGTYSTPQTVTISDATSGATIYYTTNGTTPTTSSSVYSSPITVTPPETVEAIAAETGYTTSAVGSAAYTITGATGAVPVILFTDVQSGPATGGENGNGIYLTIFGYNFGSAQGASTVTINGTAVAQYLTWGSAGIGTVEKIGVQIAAGTTTGPIVVNVGGYPSVNNPTFTVRAGKIWFIGSGTDNSAPGSCAAMEAANSYSTPWGLTNYASTTESNYSYSTMRTPETYYHCMSPGDTLVFLNGVDYPYFDGRGWHASLTPDNSSTTSTSFMTIMARPGATATLGGEGWVSVGIRNTGTSSYTVYSGLTIIGSGSQPNSGSGLEPDPYDRIVGNTIMCPDCGGASGALTGGNNNVALGNIITSVSTDTSVLPNGTDKEYHAVYFAGNNFEFGWNRIYNTAAYNGFQINEDSSTGFYNFSIHDNDIADVYGSGINLSDIDPSSGYVQVYNNVIHHTGVNIASDGSGGDPHSCIAVKGYGSSTGVGTAEIYNNTMYDCSSYLNINASSNSSCAVLLYVGQPSVTTNLVNNIVYQPTYAGTSTQNVYICGGGAVGPFSGSNNIWYSDSTPGSTAYATTIGTIENPLYSNPADGSFSNYLLQSGSPAIGAGVVVGPVVADGISYSTLNWDFNYSPRPNPPSIGAFESGAAVQAPTSTALTASSTSITLGNSLTLTATVTSGGSPTGTVTFLNGSTTLGTGTVNGSGVATYMTSSLAVGSYTLTAQYNGDSSFAPSTSGAFAVIVNPVNLPAAATPTFSPGAGTYSSVQTVTISSTTSGAAIYYTTDGTTPTTSSTLYSSSISVSASETLQAIAVATSYTQSAVGSAAYVINLPAAATPTFSPGAGTYSSAQTVTISSTTSGAAIYYTTDGTTPTTSSTLYSGPVTVSTSDPITLRAIAIASGYPQSAASSATYTISYRAGAIHTVQFMSAWEAQAASLAVPFANNVISGDVILVAEGISQKATYAVPTDTQGNTFTQLATADDTNGGEMAAIFVATAQSTAADTVTCNSAVSMHTIHCHIYEVAGVTTTVDQTGSTTQDLVTALSVSTSAPTTNANDYVFAYFAGGDYDDNFTVGPGYGDTQTSNSSTGDSGFSEGAVTTATGVQTATATSNPADNFSDVVVALVGQTQAAATPTFSPAAGSYSSAQTVTISDSTSGATIYYTTDGTTPTTSSTVYSAPISVTASETVEAIAAATGYTTSAVGSAAYTVTMGGSAAATPTFSPGAGTYSTPQTVTISDATSGATIYYTTNGTTPTTSSSVYSSPITVTPPETVEAIAAETGYTTSAVGSAAYTITGATGAVPVILFTDVQSGPATGGENGNGIYLTIFGYNFGSAQGASTVTINGTAVAQYLTWGSAGIGTVEKIGVQIAAGTTTGPIVVNVGGYPSVNNPTFTVRAGKIWFIGSGTDNSAPGSCAAMEAANSYSTPWGLTNYASTTESNYSYSTMRTPYTYYNCMSPGDTLVFLNGVDYPYFDGRGWHSSLTPDNPNTTSTSFMTIMARPGATATLGGEGWVQAGIRNTGASSYTVYSGLTLIGSGPNGGGLNPDVYDRFVGNTIMCPDCSGPAGAMTGGNNNEALGNIITSISTDTSVLPNGSNKTYHAVYFSGDNFEFGWNRIYNTAAYNGFQINEDSSSGYYNFSIHDNDIADVNGSGINLSTIDPSSGYVQVYNNVIHHTGVALASDGGSDDPHSCIAVKGYGSATGAGTAEIYNNTMYDCSSYLNASGAASGEGESCAIFIPANQLNVTTNLVNNIAYQPSYTYTSVYNVYICGDGTAGTISGSNNIWYSGSTPGSTAYATTIGTIENPLYSNPADGSFSNYLLQSGSPAIGAGVAVGPVVADGISYSTLNWDFNYSPRPNPPSIGAFEFPQ